MALADVELARLVPKRDSQATRRSSWHVPIDFQTLLYVFLTGTNLPKPDITLSTQGIFAKRIFEEKSSAFRMIYARL